MGSGPKCFANGDGAPLVLIPLAHFSHFGGEVEIRVYWPTGGVNNHILFSNLILSFLWLLLILRKDFTFDVIKINYRWSVLHFAISIEILLKEPYPVLLHIGWVPQTIIQIIINQSNFPRLLSPLRYSPDRLSLILSLEFHQILVLMAIYRGFDAMQFSAFIWEYSGLWSRLLF